MRIVFAGTPDFAAEHLRFLLDQHCAEHHDDEIIGVYTQPDRPCGRGKKLTSSSVKLLAEARNIPIYQPVSLRHESEQQPLIQLNPDILIVVAYGLILPTKILSTPKYGCINVHASLLPRWRGAAPIHRAIEAGDTETGISIMQMDEGLDTGDILLRTSCSIECDDTYASLHDKLLSLGGPALGTVLQQIKTHQLKSEKQNNAETCYAPKITKAEAKINWSEDADLIHRKIRAFNPFPISYFELNDSHIRVWQARVLTEKSSTQAGTILSCSKEGIRVATGEKILLLQRLQLPGKKTLPVSDLLNGYSDWFSVGKVLH